MLSLIIKNSGSNVSVLVIKLIITFIITPIIIMALGDYDYGIWQIIISVVGYMGLLDAGMKPAITRYAAQYSAKDERDNLDTLYATSFVFMLIIGFSTCLAFILWAIYWPEILSDENANELRYTVVLIAVGCQLLFTFPGYVAESFLEGFQKYTIKNNITIFNSIIGASLLYYFINDSNGLILLALLNSIGISIKYLIYFYLLATNKHGAFRINFSKSSFTMMHELFMFGGKSFIQGIGHRLESGSAPLIIAALLNPSQIIFFSIPAGLVEYIRSLGWTITQTFMPAFASLHSQGNFQEIRNIYLSSSRYVMAILFPLGVGIYILGDIFIGIWIGNEYALKSKLILNIIVFYYLLPFINPFSTRYLTAIGKHGLLARLYPLVGLLNIIFSCLFIMQIGIEGAAWGALLPLCFSVPYILIFCLKSLEIKISDYIRRCFTPLLIPLSMLIFVLISMRHNYNISSYLELAIITSISGVIYLLAYFLASMDRYEKENFLGLIMQLMKVNLSIKKD